MAIKSVKCIETKRLIDGEPSKWDHYGFSDVANRKLTMISQANCLKDLRSPPANRLEALKGDLAGCYSIRINDQWRIVFGWDRDGAEEVVIVDYHPK